MPQDQESTPRKSGQRNIRPLEVWDFLLVAPLVIAGTVFRRRLPGGNSRLMGSASTPAGLENLTPLPSSDYLERRVALAVERASHRIPGDHNCLSQALASKWALSFLGKKSRIVIGVIPNDHGAPWDTHAWLISQSGMVIGGGIAGSYTPVTIYE